MFKKSLIRDPIDHLGYELKIEANLNMLRYKVKSNKYRPKYCTVIRAAKKKGLTRPLSFLEIEDQLLYSTICESIKEPLHKDLPPYVKYGRSDNRKKVKQNDVDEEMDLNARNYEDQRWNWFQNWLIHNKHLYGLSMNEEIKYIVKTDISNFFATIPLPLLRTFIASKAGVSRDIINLLFLILEGMLPKPNFETQHMAGIPQEDFDGSRTLAHAYLLNHDINFKKEGEKGRYARWVDDMTFGTSSYEEAVSLLNRVQQSLENLGLFINTEKTEILEREKFYHTLYPDENRFLDHCNEILDTKSVNSEIIHEFEERLRAWLEIKEGKRHDNWDRVLRRYYSLAGQFGSRLLISHAIDHIRFYPKSTQHFLNYLSIFHLERPLANQIFKYLSSQHNVYQDVEILLYEFLLQAPLRWEDEELRAEIVKNALNHFFARQIFKDKRPLTGYVRGLISLLVLKYCENAHYHGQNREIFFKFQRQAFLTLSKTIC
ncbi:hypothetical protein BSNK01_22670 [Bacillaceae bacterium]